MELSYLNVGLEEPEIVAQVGGFGVAWQLLAGDVLRKRWRLEHALDGDDLQDVPIGEVTMDVGRLGKRGVHL